MAGQYSAILATDYNVIQSKVALVLGSGTENTGYGQSVSSSQVTSRTNVTFTQWNNLRADLLKCRQHQTGLDLTASLNIASTTVNVTEADRSAFNQMANDISTPVNRLITPPDTEATRENLVPVQQRSTAWNGTLTQTVTVTFQDYDTARYFFNTGSQIEISGNRTLGSDNLKNTTWTSMLSTMGTIEFKHDSTSNTTGSSETNLPAETVGFYQLSTTDKIIFQKNSPSGSYAENRFFVLARLGSTGATQIIFTITFQDATGGPVDENPDGLLTTSVQAYYASGNNVSVTRPPATTSSIA